MMRPEQNPFYTGSYCGQPFFSHSVEERLEMVETFTALQCRRALEVQGLQLAVVDAVSARLAELAEGVAQ
ncbi:hypothetical protein MO867_13450 [Microbulbifer sp. OS29]|uniref:Uncharacterized protein n=1 Tax=Microbulbifer okhotskensis TaxID=2926617 RepID=A0A9X2J5L7_9GAMM|nr:hypothetical protein [Microbulbifer okhotskensis]MCO1335338.1 hypothetical protein [Microbulbifer okhotskensis]